MIIYAGIDGTSPLGDEEYKVDFKNSFVNRMFRNELVPFSDTYYSRGPTTLGNETYALARAAHIWVVTRWKTGLAKAIFLAGYSRGAAAMIEVASWLKDDGIPVECLILFDAVDRSMPGPGGGVGGVLQNTKIGHNVRLAIHPMRDIEATRSRIFFGRCGQEAENPAMPFPKQYFFGTHAAIGGTPWTKAVDPVTGRPWPTIWEDYSSIPTNVTLAQDAACAAMVASWTYPQIISAFQKCQQRLKAPVEGPHVDPQPGNPYRPEPGGPYRPQPGIGERIHIVKSGDWLSKIAITYYGDMNKWKVIYNHPENRQTIGPNPDLIKPGQRLVIP